MKLFSQRFQELSDQLAQIEATEKTERSALGRSTYQHIDGHIILNWAVKARSLISSVCGRDSEHYASFVEAEKRKSIENNPMLLKRIGAIFFAAKEDFEGGYLNSIRNLIQAELAGSEIEQARELLTQGYIAAAAVVAGVVLETTLRGLCLQRGLTTGSIDRMNADLAKAGEYNALVQKRITSLAAIRNSAAHGKTAEYNKEDVSNMITEAERFVTDRLQ